MKHNFKNLEIWKRGMALAGEVYKLSEIFPGEEKFGLTAQIRRSAVSIPSNIAEGCGRGTTKQMSLFVDIAVGSSCELETQIYLATDLLHIDKTESEKIISKIEEVRKMMIGFQKSLRTKGI